MPPTPSAPVPTPTQVVQLQLPNDVLDRLTPPDPGWFTQPVATVIAAGIALIIAGFALLGVRWQVRAAFEAVRRKDVSEALTAALACASQLTHSAIRIRHERDEPSDNYQRFDDQATADLADMRVATERLRLLGLSSAGALRAFRSAAFDYAYTSVDDEKGVEAMGELEEAALAALREELESTHQHSRPRLPRFLRKKKEGEMPKVEPKQPETETMESTSEPS